MTLLDTDVCIEILRGNARVLDHRRRHEGPVAISFMTVGELFYGAARSADPEHNRPLVERFLLSVSAIHSDRMVMERFGLLKADLARRGEPLTDADVLIAATALARGATLITGNTAHYARIPGLRFENWIR